MQDRDQRMDSDGRSMVLEYEILLIQICLVLDSHQIGFRVFTCNIIILYCVSHESWNRRARSLRLVGNDRICAWSGQLLEDTLNNGSLTRYSTSISTLNAHTTKARFTFAFPFLGAFGSLFGNGACAGSGSPLNAATMNFVEGP
jgi:hypothetical protein